MRPSWHPSSVHQSVTLSPPKPLGGIRPILLITLLHGKDVQEKHYFSVRPSVSASVVRPSVRHTISSYITGWNSTKRYISSLMVRVCESNIFACVRRPFICPSRYLLLNHQVEFNQTCYITSPHGKGVREQHYLFCPFVHSCIRHPSICDQQPGSPKSFFTVRYFFKQRDSISLFYGIFTNFNYPQLPQVRSLMRFK